MNCNDFREELKSWIELRWPGEDEGGREVSEKKLSREFFIHAKNCKNCCALSEGTVFLLHGKKLQVQPPRRLYDKIEKSLDRAYEETGGSRLTIKKVLSKIVKFPGGEKHNFPGWLPVPAAGIAAAVILIFLFFAFIRPVSNMENKNTVTIHLYFKAPGASEVSVVGDWNGWDPSVNRMKDPDGDGIWEIELKLRAGGEYQYQFIIDGSRWVPDPNAPLQVDDGFGSKNSILQI